MRITNSVIAILFVVCATMSARSAVAQGPQEQLLGGVEYEQKLGEQVPLQLSFTNEQGQPVMLNDYAHDSPIVLVLGYYECPMLCSLVHDGMITALKELEMEPPKDFQVVSISIDPGEKPALAAQQKQNYMQRYARPGAEAGFHFLTGNEDSIDKIAEAVGFNYRYDPETDQYAHPSGFVVLTPRGKISQYFLGLNFDPEKVRSAIATAANEESGNPVKQLVLRCFAFDPETGKYGMTVIWALRVGALLTIGTIGFFVVKWTRSEKASKGREEVA